MDQGRAAGRAGGRGERGCSGSPAASLLGSLPVLRHSALARETSCSSGPPSLRPLTLRGTLTRVVLWRHIPPRPNAGLESHGEGEAGGCYCSKTGGGKRSDTIQCGLLQNTADRKGTREQQSVSCCHGLLDTFFIVRCWTGELGLVLRPPTSTPGPPLRQMTKGRR